MSTLSRREFLCRLFAAYATTLVGCKRGDRFARETVCIHIFETGDAIPPPLLVEATVTSRNSVQDYFNIGLPELAVCSTRTRFLDMFQYFWPFSREDFERLQRSIKIEFQRALIGSEADIDALTHYVSDNNHAPKRVTTTAVIFTLNDYTAQFVPAVVSAFRRNLVQEFVLFKDPSRPPYLCDYPARQRGFKKPPP